MLAIESPIPQFFALDGAPLNAGKLYFGTVGANPEVSPVAVYWDAAGTIPATQPINTSNGYPVNGSTLAPVFTSGDYSLNVRNAAGELVLYAPNSAEFSNSTALSASILAVLSDLASTVVGKGAALVGWLRRMTGAVATTVEKRLGWNEVCVFEFMSAAEVTDVQSRAALLDVSTALQAAIDEAWKAGKRCYMPAGKYKGRITLPYYDGSNTYQGDAFELYGEGAANGFLGGSPYDKGTTLVAPDSTGVTLRYLNGLGAATSGNHIYIRGIRFEHTSVNPVVQLDRFSDYSVFERCEIRQHGTGAGLRCLHAYGGTIRNVHSMNDDLVVANPAVRTSVAFDIQTASGMSGGLLRLDKLTGRGFQIALSLGTSSDGVVASRVTQFEGSTVTFGIIINAGMAGTVIDTPYFEDVQDTCIQDQGRSTRINDGFFFEGYLYGIDSRYSEYGNSYLGNHFHLNSDNCVAIAVQSTGDATGTKKFIRDNFFFFLGSGGTMPGVVGISVSGANPKIEMGENSFRPNRSWVGGAGTAQISDSSTGRLSGSVVTADANSTFPLYSNVGLSLAYSGNSITQANVSAGVLTLPVDSDIDCNASAGVAVTSVALGSGRDRIVVLNTFNANMTFTKGALMKLSADFAPATGGSLTLLLRTSGGTTTAYELARTTF